MCQVGAGVGTISATHIVCALWNPRIRPRIRGSRKSRLQSPRDLVYKVDIIRVSASLAQFGENLNGLVASTKIVENPNGLERSESEASAASRGET